MRIACLLLLVAPLARAGEDEYLREDIASLRFLNALALSRTQALQLLPLAERGAFLRRDFERERDQLYMKLQPALVRFREEDLRNEGLSQEVMTLAGGLDHALKTMGNRVAAAMAPYEQRAAEILSKSQRALAFPEQRDDHPLDLLRTLKGSDYHELRDNLARSLARMRRTAGVLEHDNVRAERLRIGRVLHDIYRMDEAAYLAQREALLRSLVPDRERDQIAAEIRRIYRMRYGHAGPLAEHLFRERMLPILAERAGIPAPELPSLAGSGRTVSRDIAEIRREVAELKADINLLNLMNGLHLDVRQLETIRVGARACAKVAPRKERVDPKRETAALREVYAALRKNEPPPASALARLQSPLAKRGAGYARARQRDLDEARAKGVDETLAMLCPEQEEVIRTYKACLVPPQDLRDPVRAGQANDTSGLERLLDRLRASDLGDNPKAVADRFVRSIEAIDGKIPAAQRDCMLMLVVGVAYEAQALSEPAYAARRTELAERLRPLQRLEMLRDRLGEIEGADDVIRAKTATFLLDPRIVPLVDDRLRRLTQKNPTVAARDIPTAETCEPGKCGKP